MNREILKSCYPSGEGARGLHLFRFIPGWLLQNFTGVFG
jgi:hypothetical protein